MAKFPLSDNPVFSGLGPKPRCLVIALAGSGESAALGLPSTSLQFVQGLDALLG